jgi:hypothetical protein
MHSVPPWLIPAFAVGFGRSAVNRTKWVIRVDCLFVVETPLPSTAGVALAASNLKIHRRALALVQHLHRDALEHHQ